MSKKDEKIIISKQLATDLIWWLENASAPCLTIREVHEHWHLFKDEQMTLARDVMKDELEKAIEKFDETAKKIAKLEPVVIDMSWLEQPGSFAEYKRNMQKAHRYMVRNSIRPYTWLTEGYDGWDG